MSYILFQKEELTNTEFAIKHEILESYGNGGYLNTTLAGCNTRKYHGLFVIPVASKNNERYVLLSSLDESIIHKGQAFNLGMHKYPGVYSPHGNKYLREVKYENHWEFIYRIGEVKILKELLPIAENRLLIKYTVLCAPQSIEMRLMPLLAYRHIDGLTHSNFDINKVYNKCHHGISLAPYADMPELFIQMSKTLHFVPSPDWYFNVEYDQERLRGYEYQEDLYTPGYFYRSMKEGESIIVSVSLKEEENKKFIKQFEQADARQPRRDSYEECLDVAAKQFTITTNAGADIIAGYPWFGVWGRDTFISLPGLTLCGEKNEKLCKEILLTNAKQMVNGLIPNVGKDEQAQFHSVDASLWYIWSVQQYALRTGDTKWVKSKMIPIIKDIIAAYRNGVNKSIRMEANGLIWAKEEGKAFTWMDAVVNGQPVTQRGGYAVEINALWYNAICFLMEYISDKKAYAEYNTLRKLIEESFMEVFWLKDYGYLADYVDEEEANWFVRPNQIIACGLPYCILDKEKSYLVLNKVAKELYTVKGLRTLSPKNVHYIGYYEGNQEERDRAYHQGTVWPWLTQFYFEAHFRLYGASFIRFATDFIRGFQEDMHTDIIGSVNEIYDGNPPYVAKGAPAQAWSVAALRYINELVSNNAKQ
ncbi:MAG: amylo-alpha-1,6-glucosidase [Marinifilaceae bacterium]